jgi:hypothetical protein
MITNTIDFIELLAEEGKELYNAKLDIKTNRVTAPLNADLSDWVEIEIENE